MPPPNALSSAPLRTASSTAFSFRIFPPSKAALTSAGALVFSSCASLCCVFGSRGVVSPVGASVRSCELARRVSGAFCACGVEVGADGAVLGAALVTAARPATVGAVGDGAAGGTGAVG